MIFPGSLFGDDSDQYVRISYLQPLAPHPRGGRADGSFVAASALGRTYGELAQRLTRLQASRLTRHAVPTGRPGQPRPHVGDDRRRTSDLAFM